jgi:hypothetical protein
MQQNMLQRNAVLSNAIEMKQQIASMTIDPTTTNILNIAPRNVGLIKGFIVEVTGTVTNGATTVANRSQLGSANMISQFQFTDLNNNNRIIAPGWYVAVLNSARQGWVYGGAYAPNIAMNYGNNWNVNAGPATVAAATDAALRHIYYVPLAYSGDDLRGSIYAAVVNATMNLQITINRTPFVGASPADQIGAIYTDNANGTWKTGASVNVTVYQVYLDQLPAMNGGPILPIMDLNTIYELKQTTLTGVAANQDFPIPYANFRDFLSTTAVYDNGGIYNVGSDINYWSLQSANYTNLFKLTPEIVALEARQKLMADPPRGVYYFDHRNRPINTISFGNMELNLNASSVATGAQVLVGFEAFAQVNQLVGGVATSLAAG